MFPRSTQRRPFGNHRTRIFKSLLTRTWLVSSVVCLIAIVSVYVAFAAISISTSVPYTQNFDGLGVPPSNPAPSSLPANFRADNISAVRTLGSYFAASSQTARVAGANMATNAASGSYNFGSGTATLGGTDRAVGFIASGTATQSGNLYAELSNDTGTNLVGVQIAYDVEKYRNGSNPSGFRIQLYYSSDGSSWTNAGPNFLTSFTPNADNSGFATAPGATVSVSNTLNVNVPDKTKLYLSWNYSVNTGTTTTNAQALGIDNISILGLGLVEPTNPSGVGTANPTSVPQGTSTLLTVAVTPGTNPPSLTHAVNADLFLIGDSSNQPFFDDGTHGDVTPNDNTFSFTATVANGTSAGLKNLPFTITEVGGLPRVGSGTISLTVPASTDPSGLGAANPNSILPTEQTVLTVITSSGSNPPSTNLAVSADLSTIGGLASQQFFNDGVSGGDVVANDNVFTYTAAVPLGTTPGAKSLGFTVSDAQGRSGTGSIALTVQQPPPDVDHIVISQIYGGGGNSGATFTNDYVELYNPTGVSFNLAGWSLQYASAAGTSWTNKQPIGGTIAPGEYFLIGLASGGANGAPLPVSPNISGDINMSATTGKVALVSNSVNLSGSCPNGVDGDIVDFVGYGTTASCFEGSGRAPAPSATTAIFRKMNGALDSNQNNSDFQTGAPNPRRTAPIVELGPWVAGTDPIAGATNVPYDATITVDFSEPVDVSGNWYDITCTSSGQHNSATVAAYDSFKGYHITPNNGFQFGEQCTVTIFHNNVHDQDLDDSNPETDTLFADHSWTFTVVAAGAPAPYLPDVHLALGNPSNAVVDLQQPNNYLMEKPAYTLSYNRDKGTPNWVSWHLDQDWFGSLARVDTFRADPAVPADWYRVQSTDYFSTGFDRGHMTPNADRDNENRIPINQETYLMSNMVPQAPDNNQGPWADLENDLRTMLNGSQNEMYIVSGPLGSGGTGSNGGVTNTIMSGHITVPAFTWKVALVMPKGDNDVSRVTAATRTIAVLMPNVQGIRNNDWHIYLTTVDNIENLTGYDFFANVPDAIENAIEAGTDGNNPPGTENQFATIAEDTPGTVALNAVSPLTNPSFTYTVVEAPSHGVLSGSGPGFLYSPALDYHGTDSFTFKVNDGNHDSNTSTVNITVTEVNDSPAAADDSATTNEDTPLNISALDLTTNDSVGPADESGQTLTVTTVSATGDTHGSVVLNSGIVTYTPDADYNGPASFTYQVCDNGTTNGSPDSKCASATVNVNVNSVNDNPVAVDDAATTDEDTSVTVDVVTNDTDVDGDARTLQSVGTAANGSVTIVSGQARYSPNANFHGIDSFTYVVSDDHGGTANGTVTITVAAINDAPTANSQSVSTNANTPKAITLTGSDLETAAANLNFVVTVGPTHGSLTGTGETRTYTPAANYSGPDSFKFTVTDNGDGSAAPLTSSAVTVSITVNDTVNPTVTAPANVSLGTGAGATACSLLISDATLGTATASDNSGTVSIQRTGVPAGNIFPVGTTIITYTATDGAGNTAQGTQSVVVTDTTPPSFTAPAPITVNADSSGHGTVPNFLLGLTAQNNCSGQVAFTQNPTAGTSAGVGTHTVTITATDQAGKSSSRTTTFTVQANNGGLVFSLEVSPSQVRRGRTATLKASYRNNTGTRQSVTFVFKYASPCGNCTIGNIGPIRIAAGTHGNADIPLWIPNHACTGVYSLTLESYVGGHLIGTTTATLTVTR
jgi:DNA/RNA endonuclease G (NUC1)